MPAISPLNQYSKHQAFNLPSVVVLCSHSLTLIATSHNRTRKAAATAVIGADARALSTLRLDDRTRR
ncbi:hypothetical protein P153DRAFT_371307 [Dothidotthia symphoricarpi CBS 119687]|uniref:Uncharacterized protein n=1 Tax=Dothidotthia symphoricarpi CBS 119687 TaxID=1392245 RepID=A0A6A5ZXK5_9PLEO|nr:uncharacterized protein P153DRAFT_371307 [Dothidotthia symphoricarpi CBS 119687]KAF2124006.1 hypothetical protein P153DRAFT_371307 [Dothidotthia symphoricarpi CBS 119687]